MRRIEFRNQDLSSMVIHLIPYKELKIENWIFLAVSNNNSPLIGQGYLNNANTFFVTMFFTEHDTVALCFLFAAFTHHLTLLIYIFYILVKLTQIASWDQGNITNILPHHYSNIIWCQNLYCCRPTKIFSYVKQSH